MSYDDPGRAFDCGLCVFVHMGKAVLASPDTLARTCGYGIGRERLHGFFRRMIECHHAQGYDYTGRRGTYVFYSKSMRFAAAVDYCEDPLAGYQGLHYAVEAVLPPMPGGVASLADLDGKYRIAPFEDEIGDVDDFCLYFGWLLQEYDGDEIRESEKVYSYNTKKVVVGGCEISMILCENGYWDLFLRDLLVCP